MSRKKDNVTPPASDLNMELLGVSSLNSFKRFNSSAREAMMANHLGQAPVVKGSEQRRIFTGAEAEYGKYTFTIKFPVDCKILKVMRKFQRGLGDWTIKENPTTYVLYEAYDDPMRTVGMLEIPSFANYHKDFGFEMVKRREVWDRIREGEMIGKDEIIASSIALSKDGEYGFGINAEVAALSVPSTIEDGFLVSRKFLERLETKGYHTLSADWGKSYFPLNLYGDDTHYKPFPDVGDHIRPDGLVFALREMDGHESMMDITPKATRTVDYAFDKLIYGKANAKVADITVYHDTDIDHPKTPLGMEEQASNYYNAEAEFYKEVVRTYRELNKRRNGTLKITPEFNQLVIRALTFLPSEEKRKLTRMHRLDKLDEYRVDLTYEYTLRPNMGFKGTSLDG